MIFKTRSNRNSPTHPPTHTQGERERERERRSKRTESQEVLCIDRLILLDLHHRGISVVVSVFLLYCMIQLRDGLLLRPHPAVW